MNSRDEISNVDRIKSDYMSLIVLYGRVLMGVSEADKRLSISMELSLIKN